MTAPLVSILMPTYRRPRYLRMALASAVNQTYQNLQIIVRDNASGDETPDVVRSFNDPRIEFYQAAETSNSVENGKECFSHVRGKYVFFICDDDRVGPTYAEVLVGHLERDQSVLVAYGATHLIDEADTVTGSLIPEGTYTMQGADVLGAWCAGKLPLATGANYFCTAEFLRAFAREIRFINGQHSDNSMFVTAAIRGKVLFTDECQFFYRKYPLNSGNFFRYHERMEADRDFLLYLDRLVFSESNVGLPRARWGELRVQLQCLLANHYYDLFREHHLEKETLWNFVRAAFLDPIKSYGIKICIARLRREKFFVMDEIRHRASGGLLGAQV